MTEEHQESVVQETAHEQSFHRPDTSHYPERVYQEYYRNGEGDSRPRASGRDWLTVFLQAIGIIVVIGLPCFIAGINQNAEIAVLSSRLDRVEHDSAQVKNYQDLTSTQMLELNKQLATIAAQVTDIRDVVRSERRGVDH